LSDPAARTPEQRVSTGAAPAGLAPLTRPERVRLVAEILRAYAIVRWRMREPDIRIAIAHLRGESSGERRIDFPLTRRLARGVVRTLTLLPTDSRCLARSLVLDRLLTRRSLASVVVIAAQSGAKFEAHAWVEHDGVAVLPPGSEGYQRLVEI
jgi:hypothetical protein